MSTRTRRSKSANGGNASMLWGIALIALALIAIVSILAFYQFAERAPKLRADNLCPIDGPRGVTIVLVDTSDDLPPPSKLEAKRYLQDIAENLPAFYLLDIRVLDVAAGGSRSIFEKCNPGTGKDASELTGNPELDRRRWLESFEAPFKRGLDSSLMSAKANSSPIMMAIQQIAIERFTGKAVESLPKSLIIVSDMIEHSPPDYSQYCGSDLSFDRYKRSRFYLKSRTDLRGAAVNVMYVSRAFPATCKFETRQHAEFWGAWFKDSNAKSTGIKRLQGAG